MSKVVRTLLLLLVKWAIPGLFFRFLYSLFNTGFLRIRFLFSDKTRYNNVIASTLITQN